MVWGVIGTGVNEKWKISWSRRFFIYRWNNGQASVLNMEKYLQSSMDSLDMGRNWIFQKDNDLKHNPRLVKDWLLFYTPRHCQLHSGSQSPDLNPIELVKSVQTPSVKEQMSFPFLFANKTCLGNYWHKKLNIFLLQLEKQSMYPL